MIFEKTYDLIRKRYKDFDNLSITDVRIGLYLTAVHLSDDSWGTSATISDDQPVCAKSRRDFGDFTPLQIKGRKVSQILDTAKDSGIMSSLKTAVISALSSRFIESGNYNIEYCDPVGLLKFSPGKNVTLVGAFQSYIRRIVQTGSNLRVLERNKNCLTEDQKEYFIPADQYNLILPHSDIVIITGQTIVNRTIDDLLSSITPGTEVVVTGPSSNLIPDVLFANKVSIIGTLKILDHKLLFDLVGEGGTGYHLFEYSAARKISIISDNGTEA